MMRYGAIQTGAGLMEVECSVWEGISTFKGLQRPSRIASPGIRSVA